MRLLKYILLIAISITIALPLFSNGAVVVETQIVNVGDEYLFYRAKRGETLRSIAADLDIPIRVLRQNNRNILILVEGDMVRIPLNYVSSEVVARLSSSTAPKEEVKEELPSSEETVFAEEVVDRLSSNVKSEIDIALLLPFFLADNRVRSEIVATKTASVFDTIPRSEDWIFPRSQSFIEMYQGILVAVNDLRKEGININLSVYDITVNPTEAEQLINTHKLDNMDLIIGPVYSSVLKVVADFASQHNIPIVSPVQLADEAVLENHSTLFATAPFMSEVQQNIADEVSRYYNENIIFIRGESVSDETTQFSALIKDKLEERGNNFRFTELSYSGSPVMVGNRSVNRVRSLLSADKRNIVVIDSENPSIISAVLQDIHVATSGNAADRLHVFGYPFIRTMENLDPIYLFELNLHVASPNWIDYSQEDITNFVEKFYGYFATEPSDYSYAWSGYDIAYFFISGVAKYGDRLMHNIENHNPNLLQTKYDFKHTHNENGYKNHFVYTINYTNDYSMDIDKR